jgi:SNF2 family DNA or RNA helicase
MILALDMGLGKTLIGCVWAKSFVRTMEELKVVIICPVSLKKEWKRTGEEATGLSVADGESDRDLVDHDVIIVSWAKVPDKLNASNFVVVADEAHTMQSMQAARTKNALHLMESPSCVGVLLLTGTPMKNGKPSNLFPLLKAVRHPLGRNQRLYETHFCAGKEIRLGNGPVIWTATGSSNVSQLRELSQSHLLYLSKETCLKELPPQTRIVKKVPVSSRMQAQHDRALNELAKIYKTNMDSRSAVGNDAVLGATQRLRMVSSLAKTDAAIELSLAVLNQEAAIVVFTSFVEVAKTIHKKLMESGWNAELLTGETPAKKRQDMVDNFQKGLSPVFVSTFGAGGVGLTLTAACTIVLVDRPWTPGEANQAEDRVRRIGQTRPVKSIWISAFDLDEKIDALLASKSQTANEVLTGNSSQSSHQQGSIIPLILNTVLTPHLL